MKTVLYQEHVKLGAKIVDFAGWQMPLQYKSILAEHNAVRSSAGIFDVSHMGIIHIKGEDAETFLNFLSVNSILEKPNNSATYTVLCNENGGSVDDTIIYKLGKEHFFIVANASNREKDAEHLKKHLGTYAVLIEEDLDSGIISLQGPESLKIMQNLFPVTSSLRPMRLTAAIFENVPIVISRTGYTGEIGFEIFAANALLPALWKKLLSFEVVQPCGLGARDTLRLEKGYALYGHELSESINPLESVAFWVVKMNDHEFLGKNALSKSHRHAYGIVLEEKAIAREGFSVFKDKHEIGKVTSGNFSPTLNASIGLILSNCHLALSDIVEVHIRDKFYKAKISSLPFI